MLSRIRARALPENSQKSGGAPDELIRIAQPPSKKLARFWRFELHTGGAGLEVALRLTIGRGVGWHNF